MLTFQLGPTQIKRLNNFARSVLQYFDLVGLIATIEVNS